jgi:hypothetical protein
MTCIPHSPLHVLLWVSIDPNRSSALEWSRVVTFAKNISKVRSFDLSIRVGYRRFHLRVERIEAGPVMERFKVSARDNRLRYFILVSNRPALRSRYGLKHKPPMWTMVGGGNWSQSAFDELVRKIMEQIEPPQTR